jgi:glycolate oxidase iron-sulfur subunit
MFNFSEYADLCIKCGKCIPGCTIHRVNPDEVTSPRGFVELLRGVEEGKIPLDDRAKEVFESCFLCNQCVEVCPNSIPTDFLIENVRHKIAEKYSIPRFKRFFFFLLKHRWAYDILARFGVIFQSCGFQIEKEKNGMRARFNLPFIQKGRILPRMRFRPFLKKYPAEIKGEGKRRVAIFIGCLANYHYTEVGDALIKILKFLGFDIFIPKKQLCCGAPAYFTGDFKTTEELIKHNLDYFATFIDEVEAILVPEATCTAMLKKDYREYIDHYLPEYRELHKKVASKIFGTTYWLTHYTDLEERLAQLEGGEGPTITYHDACHFARVFGIKEEPRRLLNQVGELREMEGADVCCGFGGITIQTERFQLARQEGLYKANLIKKVEADYISAECSACRIQITEHLDKVGDRKLFRHPLELIADRIDRAHRS